LRNNNLFKINDYLNVLCGGAGVSRTNVRQPQWPNGIGLGISWCDELFIKSYELKTPIGLVPTQVRNNDKFIFVVENVLSSAYLLYRGAATHKNSIWENKCNEVFSGNMSARNQYFI